MEMRAEYLRFEIPWQPAETAPARRWRGLFRTPLKMLSVGRILRGGRLNDVWRLRRYLLVLGLVFAGIWLMVAGYTLFTPPGYTSKMTLILPGSGTNASINLRDIGQASSYASSPYSSSSVSPTVTYKQLVTSEQVREAAAARLGLNPAAFPKPRVKLVDQTNLILVETKAARPDEARAEAEALLAAFMAELEMLRADEIARREEGFRSAIADYHGSVAQTREQITRLQSETGLISVEQYAGMVADTDALDIRVRDLAAQLSLKESALQALTKVLGVSPERAALTLKLHADPEFQSLAAAMSAHGSEVADARATYGPNHPLRVAPEQAYAGARARAFARAATVTGLPEEDLGGSVDFAPTGERAGLLAQIVTLTAERDGLAAKYTALSAKLEAARTRVMKLVSSASALDDLGRDYQVAEAVFTSALARNNTTKTDVYASYPLVQVLEPPSSPEEPSSPNVTVAIAGGMAASVMALIALLMGWTRRLLIDRLLRRPDATA